MAEITAFAQAKIAFCKRALLLRRGYALVLVLVLLLTLAIAGCGGKREQGCTLSFDPAPGSPFAAGELPQSVVVADVNGDGRLDLAIANSASNDVSVLLGDGSGGFKAEPGSPFAAGEVPQSVAVGDFNDDGRQDIAVTHVSGDMSVMLGDRSTSFKASPGSPFAASEVPMLGQVVTTDFNGDGRQDLASAGPDSSDISVLLGHCD
jgi:hypothetical protein